jgi:hypothetical protein
VTGGIDTVGGDIGRVEGIIFEKLGFTEKEELTSPCCELGSEPFGRL